MDGSVPNWGQIAITGKRRASAEFGRSCSDPNLVPICPFFEEHGYCDHP